MGKVTILLRAVRKLPTMYVRFPKLMVGITIILVYVVIAGLANVLVPYDPSYIYKVPPDLPPSLEHPLGTDTLGRDVAAQLIYCLRNSLMIGALAGSLAALIGIFIGFISGYNGGLVDSALSTLINVFLVIPLWPFLMVITSYVTFVSIPIMALLLAVFSWPWSARTLRSQVMSLKQRDFIDLARLTNLNSFEICFEELLPGMLPYIGVGFVFAISGAMLAEVGLEIVGVGPRNLSTLGLMLYLAQQRAALVRGIWWWVFPPIILLVSIFVSLQLVNMGLDEMFNPRLKRGN